MAEQDPAAQCSQVVRGDWGKGLHGSLINSWVISNDNCDIKGIASKRRKNIILKEKENTNFCCCCSVWGNEAQKRIPQSVSPDLRSSLPRMAGTAARTTDLSDPASQQRAKCYFSICCLSCFKGHQKGDEQLMVLKVTAPKEERALEQRPAALAGQGGRKEGEAKEEKRAGSWTGSTASGPYPALPQFAKINTTSSCFSIIHTVPTASPKRIFCCKTLILLCGRRKTFTAPESKQHQ